MNVGSPVSLHEERCFIGRCKQLKMYQLRTKERCESKTVILEELALLHEINLRVVTDQRAVDPRIKTIE